MGWESQLVASHTLNEALFRFYWSLAGYGTLLWVVQGLLAWPGSLPASPFQYILPFAASGLLPIIWEALHSSPWVFWTIYIMGSLPIDRTATLLMKFRPSHAPDLVLTMICQPRDPYVPFFDHPWALRPWLESMGPSCLAYAYSSIVEFSSHMLYNPPRRTLFTSGTIQALILCRGFPYCVFWLFNSCEGFLLLHVINSFLETSCLQHRRSNCASSRASSGHFL